MDQELPKPHRRKSKKAQGVPRMRAIPGVNFQPQLDEWVSSMAAPAQELSRAEYLCQMMDPEHHPTPVGVPSAMGFHENTTKVRVKGQNAYTYSSQSMFCLYDPETSTSDQLSGNMTAAESNALQESAVSNKLPYYGGNTATPYEVRPMVGSTTGIIGPGFTATVPPPNTSINAVNQFIAPEIGLSLAGSRIRLVSRQVTFEVTSPLLLASGFITVAIPESRLGPGMLGNPNNSVTGSLQGVTSSQGVRWHTVPISSLISNGNKITLTWFPMTAYNTRFARGDWSRFAPGTSGFSGPDQTRSSQIWAVLFINGPTSSNILTVLAKTVDIYEISSSLLPTATANSPPSSVEPHVDGVALSRHHAAKIYHDGVERGEDVFAGVAKRLMDTGTPFAHALGRVLPKVSPFIQKAAKILPRIMGAIGAMNGVPGASGAGALVGDSLEGSVRGFLTARNPGVRLALPAPSAYDHVPLASVTSVPRIEVLDEFQKSPPIDTPRTSATVDDSGPPRKSTAAEAVAAEPTDPVQPTFCPMCQTHVKREGCAGRELLYKIKVEICSDCHALMN